MTTTPPAPPQPGDAERLERIRKYYEVKPVAGFDSEVAERFLLRLLDARVAEITCLRADAQADTEREQRNHQKWRQDMKRLQATADVQVGEITRLRADRDNSNTLLDECRHERNVLQRICAQRARQVEQLGGIVGGPPDAAENSTAIEQPDACPDECEDEGPTPALLAGAALLRSLTSVRQPEASGEDVEHARWFVIEHIGGQSFPLDSDKTALIHALAADRAAAKRAGAEAMRERAESAAREYAIDPRDEGGIADVIADAIAALPTDTDAPIPEETR